STSLLIEPVKSVIALQNSLRDLIYPDAIFKCELLCVEFPLEVRMCFVPSGDVRAVDGLCQCLLTPFLLNEDSVKEGDSPGGITDSSFEDGVKRASVVGDYKGRLHSA
ncbi:hypothetical protein Tco_0813332, partial [Tanacetum coccineum]